MKHYSLQPVIWGMGLPHPLKTGCTKRATGMRMGESGLSGSNSYIAPALYKCKWLSKMQAGDNKIRLIFLV